MAPLTATWHPLSHLPSVPRSSHVLSALRSTLHHFSGESRDNTPSGAELHLLPLDPSVPLAVTILASAAGPSPRVDAAAAVLGDTMYVFGGRGGVDMSPLEEGGRMWSFTAGAQKWEVVDPGEEAEGFPAGRAGHAMVAEGGRIYVHAGVGDNGMLGDLWSFEVEGRRWVRCRDAPGVPRSWVGMAVTGGREIWRFAGWDGENALGGEVDVTNKEYLLTAFGESGGNGDEVVKYLQDIWAYDITAAEWSEVTTSGDKPRARGRFAAAGKGSRWLAIQGGLDEGGDRLGDWWVLMLD